jgi:hypothetical protein
MSTSHRCILQMRKNRPHYRAASAGLTSAAKWDSQAVMLHVWRRRCRVGELNKIGRVWRLLRPLDFCAK